MQKIWGKITPLSISVFVALLFHVNGMIGMAGIEKDWFVAMTPVNLMFMFALLIYTEGYVNKNFGLFFFLCFSVGMVTEIIGVNTGLLFGHYFYGAPMGMKFLGVPLLIGIQWFVSVYCSAQILFGLENAFKITAFNIFTRAVSTALITTAFDYIIEPAAIKLGYWSWYGQDIPFYNYICWLIISFFLSLFYFNIRKENKAVNRFAIILCFIQTVFFIYVSKFL